MASLQDLKESAQKMLAEAVCLHVEDFGEAGSFLQSLKQKGNEEISDCLEKQTLSGFFF